MIDIIVSESGPPITIQDITELENELALRLPNDYVQFLLQHNGGRPQLPYFSLANNPVDTHGILDTFYRVQKKHLDDVRDVADAFRDRMPPYLLPIATDPGGNQICLSIAGETAYSVYFWDHEDETPDTEDGSVYVDNLYLIAHSFTELIESLQASPG